MMTLPAGIAHLSVIFMNSSTSAFRDQTPAVVCILYTVYSNTVVDLFHRKCKLKSLVCEEEDDSSPRTLLLIWPPLLLQAPVLNRHAPHIIVSRLKMKDRFSLEPKIDFREVQPIIPSAPEKKSPIIFCWGILYLTQSDSDLLVGGFCI